MPACDIVFALDPVDMAVAKIAATASVRLSLRMARGGRDRGMKDIGVVTALLRAERVTSEAIEQRMFTMPWQPAMIVEAHKVLKEIRERAK